MQPSADRRLDRGQGSKGAAPPARSGGSRTRADLEPLATPPDCEQCGIRHRAVCAMCGPEELTELDRIKAYRTFSHGEEIIATGEDMASSAPSSPASSA